MFPAISVIATGVSLGLAEVWRCKIFRPVLVLLFLSFIAMAIVLPWKTISAAYPKPEVLREVDASSAIRPLGINFGGKARLVGYTVSKDRVRPGEDVDLVLFWEALSEFDANYSVFVHLFGKNNELIGQRDSYPQGGAYPTQMWRTGDHISDRHRVTLSPWASAPSAVKISVGLYLLPSYETLAAWDPVGQFIGTSPIIGSLKLSSGTDNAAIGAVPLAVFGGKIALIGFDISQTVVSPGSILDGTLTWRVDGSVSEDYTVFVQLVDKMRGLIAQYDAQPVRGFYPTSFWEAGEKIEDVFELAVDPNVPEGSYDLIVGLYKLSTGERLMINGDSFVKLTTIRVRKNGEPFRQPAIHQ